MLDDNYHKLQIVNTYEFKKYFSYLASQNFSINFSNNFKILPSSSKGVDTLFKNLFYVLTSFFIFIIATYYLILISNLTAYVLPNLFNLSYKGLMLTIFSLLMLNLIPGGIYSEKELTLLLKNFISYYYNNYNQLDNVTLDSQQKYFSKYEHTYFLDKKCSET